MGDCFTRLAAVDIITLDVNTMWLALIGLILFFSSSSDDNGI